MTNQSLVHLNDKVKEFNFFEFSILRFSDGLLTVAGSDDFSYYHRLELHFQGVFSIIGNLQWRVNSDKDCLSILEGAEAFEMNKQYRVEVGYNVYKFVDEDGLNVYVIAKTLDWDQVLVKYY